MKNSTKINIYTVGGCLRDELLGIPAKDIDYAVEAESFEQMEVELVKMGATVYLSKPEYFTIRAKLNGTDADFVLCRKDGFYRDNRRPDSVEVGTIYDDLARRDFTVNSFCKNIETGKIYDPFSGIQHLKEKRLVCVGGVERLEEDPLRIMRAIRFSITKGFTIDSSIQNFIIHKWYHIKKISTERIVDELNKCFEYDVEKTLVSIMHYSRNLFSWLFTHPEIKFKVISKKN